MHTSYRISPGGACKLQYGHEILFALGCEWLLYSGSTFSGGHGLFNQNRKMQEELWNLGFGRVMGQEGIRDGGRGAR